MTASGSDDGSGGGDGDCDDGRGERGEPIGDTEWLIPGGHVPVDSTGPEPEMVSHDRLTLLNAGGELSAVEITLRYAEGREAGPYRITVAPERLRHVRINDLIDPYAPPLGRAYAVSIEASAPVLVQFGRTDSRQAENATVSTMAYSEDDDANGDGDGSPE